MGLGENGAFSCQNQAFIGFPDDASWNDIARYVKADEDDPGLHPILTAMTRMGEPSVTVVPIFPGDGYQETVVPDFKAAKVFSTRSLSFTRKEVVVKLRDQDVPQGWKKSPLLRNCIPLVLDEKGRWVVNHSVRLDKELGLVHGSNENEAKGESVHGQERNR